MAKASCVAVDGDFVEVMPSRGASHVMFRLKSSGRLSGGIFLSPEDAIQFAKDILAVADEVVETEIT